MAPIIIRPGVTYAIRIVAYVFTVLAASPPNPATAPPKKGVKSAADGNGQSSKATHHLAEEQHAALAYLMTSQPWLSHVLFALPLLHSITIFLATPSNAALPTSLYRSVCYNGEAGLLGAGVPDVGAMQANELAGVTMIILGSTLRLWCFRCLGKFFTFQVTVHDDHKLINTGPYAYLLHPSYTGMYLIITGYLISLLHPTSYPIACALGAIPARTWPSLAVAGYIGAIAIAILIGFNQRIEPEERALKQKFGKKWDEHQRRALGRMFPFIW